jgi:hypothetical protein
MKDSSTWTRRPFFAPILTIGFALTSASVLVALVAQSNSSPALEDHKACSNRPILGFDAWEI